jgi:hypothetical protein
MLRGRRTGILKSTQVMCQGAARLRVWGRSDGGGPRKSRRGRPRPHGCNNPPQRRKMALTQHSRHQPQSSSLHFAEVPNGEKKPAKTTVSNRKSVLNSRRLRIARPKSEIVNRHHIRCKSRVVMLFCYFSANDMDVDTAGEFARGVRGRGLLLPLRTHLAQAPADRRRAGIRQQYRCWVWANRPREKRIEFATSVNRRVTASRHGKPHSLNSASRITGFRTR